jgi:hypothetical protein
MDQVEVTALQDLANLFVKEELPNLLNDLVSKLPATYAPLAQIIVTAALPAIDAALAAEIAKI